MDEITLFAELSPAPPDNATQLHEAARARLSEAISASAGPPARARHRALARFRPTGRRSLFLATAVALAACAAVILPLVLPGGQPAAHPGGRTVTITTAAWTVRRAPSGTITVSVRQMKDAAGLQKALRAEGAPAYVRYVPYVNLKPGSPVTGYPACSYDPPAPHVDPSAFNKIFSFGSDAQESNGTVAFIIHPAAIPPGTAVFIVVYVPSKLSDAGAAVSSGGGQFSLIYNGPPGACTSNAP